MLLMCILGCAAEGSKLSVQEAMCQCVHLLLQLDKDPIIGADVTRDGDAWCTPPEVGNLFLVQQGIKQLAGGSKLNANVTTPLQLGPSSDAAGSSQGKSIQLHSLMSSASCITGLQCATKRPSQQAILPAAVASCC